MEDEPHPDSDREAARAYRRPRPPDRAPGGQIRIVEVALSDQATPGRPLIDSPQAAANVLQRLIGQADREHMMVLSLDSGHHLLHAHRVSVGHIAGTEAVPREMFKSAILDNAARIVIGHNHPSGRIEPSAADELVAERIAEAGRLLGIELLDALIVGPGAWFYSQNHGGALRHVDSIPYRPMAREHEHIRRLTTICQGLVQVTETLAREQSAEWLDDRLPDLEELIDEAKKAVQLAQYYENVRAREALTPKTHRRSEEPRLR